MAKYKSKFLELGFYVKGQMKQFKNGVYETNNKEEIAALDKVVDAQKVKEEKPANQSKQQEQELPKTQKEPDSKDKPKKKK